MDKEETEENHGNQTAGIFSGNRGRRNDQEQPEHCMDTAAFKLSDEDAGRGTAGQLFIGSKKIRLTEAGKALYVRAESLLTMTDITKREGSRSARRRRFIWG